LPPSGLPIYNMAAGDFDGDGKDELIYTVSSGAMFYRATGENGLTQPLAVYDVLPPSGLPIYNMAAGDFDGK
ncbi:MAG: FG-GAP repeat domain-containing protein, partial [Candidatus Hydrothermarchaeales archaeon]